MKNSSDKRQKKRTYRFAGRSTARSPELLAPILTPTSNTVAGQGVGPLCPCTFPSHTHWDTPSELTALMDSSPRLLSNHNLPSGVDFTYTFYTAKRTRPHTACLTCHHHQHMPTFNLLQRPSWFTKYGRTDISPHAPFHRAVAPTTCT